MYKETLLYKTLNAICTHSIGQSVQNDIAMFIYYPTKVYSNSLSVSLTRVKVLIYYNHSLITKNYRDIILEIGSISQIINV